LPVIRDICTPPDGSGADLRPTLRTMVGIAGEDDLDAPDAINDQPKDALNRRRSARARSEPRTLASRLFGKSSVPTNPPRSSTHPGDRNPAGRWPAASRDRHPEGQDAHHLRFTQPRAMGRKVSDEFTVPLCRTHHRDNHRFGDEAAWWGRQAIDPVGTSRKLWVSTRRFE